MSASGGEAFAQLLARRRLLVCVGPGGVGKTTVAAAMGLHAARMGRKTLVLTIDPARRLATMLGLDGLDDEARPVPVEQLPPLAIGGEGEGGASTKAAPMYAAMLDTGAAYDSLIKRIAEDETHRQRIYDNRLYQVMSRSFGASHAYVAMERLYYAIEEGDYELIVLDTPPTRNALDILDAPGRLSTFLDENVVRWFIRNKQPASFRERLLSRGGAAATKLLGRIVGEQLVDDLSEFFEVFLSLREGFSRRAERVQRAMRGDDCGFVLVSSALATNLVDARFLHEGLAERGVPVEAVVFNRAFIPLKGGAGEARAAAHAKALWPESKGASGPAKLKQTLEALERLRALVTAENAAGQRGIDAFSEALAAYCVRVQTPRFDQELRDLPALSELGELLCANRDES